MENNSSETFENKLKRLETIVETLDKGNISLEEMMNLYEEGMSLSKELRYYLEKAELKIQEISKQVNSKDN